MHRVAREGTAPQSCTDGLRACTAQARAPPAPAPPQAWARPKHQRPYPTLIVHAQVFNWDNQLPGVYVLLSNLTGYQNATFTAPVLRLPKLAMSLMRPHMVAARLSAWHGLRKGVCPRKVFVMHIATQQFMLM